MSSDLYEALSLAARYLFTLLGVLIVLRAFVWLLKDRADQHARRRQLPNAGQIGEFVVLSDSPDLPQGTTLPVPWEGILGSVRSCDIVVPCNGVSSRHLRFSYDLNTGLSVFPFSGRQVLVDGQPVTVRVREGEAPLVHGSYLQAGTAMLRLRVYAGLDPNAGFPEPDPRQMGDIFCPTDASVAKHSWLQNSHPADNESA